jgi:hypothetical protein
MGKSYTSKGNATPFDFELDGVGFVCTGGVTMLDVSEMATAGNEDVTSVRGVAAMHKIYAAALGADYERFAAHVRAHHTDPETLFEIINDMLEHSGQGPTQRSGLSQPGPSSTPGLSTDDLQFPGLPAREQHHFTDAEIAAVRAQLAGGR